MGKHTPEPWVVDSRPDLGDKFYSDDETGSIIGECPEYRFAMRSVEERFANVRRIVACVNACEGISTEDLEAVPRLGLLNLSQFSSDLIAQRDHAEAQVRHFQERLAVFQAQFSMAKDLIHDLRTPVETGLHNAKVMRCELGVEKRQDELRRIENILSWKESD